MASPKDCPFLLSSARAKDSKQSKEKDRQRRYSENVDLTDGYNDDHVELLRESPQSLTIVTTRKISAHATQSRSRQRRSQPEQNENIPWNIRAAIFLEAADLVSSKYWSNYKFIAATILGQGKNAWLAEVLLLSRIEFRPPEGFVFTVTPFNFTAIGGNLCTTPALVGKNIVWKPSPTATYSDYIVHQIFAEAGSVI
ncbi:hypothetical protein BDP27DRAFT_1368313 [Rhodocollybia butyracea]|uniref:Aldehyde dehydrogenase domain-containing protein n=1 Tax=Rhodocollybia butyracea TaxID=206335 RepID=A0A9P5PGU6_9AGAR|nr:hypothetical protein BDP27DRAFT_1368313 [Rhodocollybia butyracea]